MKAPDIRSGDLSETMFCELLASLSRARETGVLRLSGPSAEKVIYLQQGSIVFASSKDPSDRLGNLLLDRGVITREQLEEAASKVSAGKRFGTALVEMGFLPASELPRWVREQVKEIIFSLFGWTEGEYRFEAGPFPSREAITLRLPTSEIFVSGLRRVQKWSVLRRGAGEIRIPYRLSPGHADLLRDVVLGADEKKILALIESRPLSMERAAVESSLSTLTVYQLFFAFRVLGVIAAMEEPVPFPKPQETDGPPLDFATTLRFVPPVPAPPDPTPAIELKKETDPAAARTLSALKEAEEAKPAEALAASPLAPSAPPPLEQDSAPVGAQTVMLRMPITEIPPPRQEPATQPPPALCETLLEIEPKVVDRPSSELQAAAALQPLPVSTGMPVVEPPSKRDESGTTQNAVSGKEPTVHGSAAARRGKTEYKVVRMEAEKLDGNGARQIEDVLRAWSGKGYRFAGVVPNKASGLFSSAGDFFFIFSRDSSS